MHTNDKKTTIKPNKMIEFTTKNTLIGPGSIPWEIGNTFSAMFKQNRLTLVEARKGLVIFDSIPLRYIKPDSVYQVLRCQCWLDLWQALYVFKKGEKETLCCPQIDRAISTIINGEFCDGRKTNL